MAVETDWVLQEPDEATVTGLASELGCPEPVAAALTNRGQTDPQTARRFLQPSPREIHPPGGLPDIEIAVTRITSAVARDERIAVFGDRDVDGMCGTAILVKTLRELDATVAYNVPGKYEGYGLNENAIEELAAADTGLLITVDCGTTASTEIAQAQAEGMDVIVTDHHDPEQQLPDALACLNPRRPDSEYPNTGLAGGAVAFKLGQAAVEEIAPTRIESYHRAALPLAAVATIGDYMPLNLENRAIALEGFDRLFDCGLPGLVETARHVGVDTVRDVSWSLVPLLNAAQEDESGELLLELLLASDERTCGPMIDQLEAYREQRKAEHEQRLQHLRECVDAQVDPSASEVLVVEVEEYVGGPAMSQVSEEWGSPVITYRRRNGSYTGGGRSAGEVDFLEVFDACSELLDDYWGHPGAAGFEVPIDRFDAFESRVRNELNERYDEAAFSPTIEIDAEIPLQQVDASLPDAIGQLGPFGPANPEPEFLFEAVELTAAKTFGVDESHCKLHPATRDDVVLLYWNGASEFPIEALPARFDIVGTVGFDSFASVPSITVTDYRRVQQ